MITSLDTVKAFDKTQQHKHDKNSQQSKIREKLQFDKENPIFDILNGEKLETFY